MPENLQLTEDVVEFEYRASVLLGSVKVFAASESGEKAALKGVIRYARRPHHRIRLICVEVVEQFRREGVGTLLFESLLSQSPLTRTVEVFVDSDSIRGFMNSLVSRHPAIVFQMI
ncbi:MULTISPECIES: hypothetical protein [Subtercola]|uniref:N-acetyltransferase n=1 Tax=Subtercola vilae TaxID=2056433 RepID=A0A4T2C3Q2_9MICO|nr:MULTISPECIES: hypothetical protein [Subtercola]MEA9984790.1 hypothetical protein [Subtercola sp. RTI3]TIH38983.1 hypothetical protein D4765_05280 [Subtercola vilae]